MNLSAVLGDGGLALLLRGFVMTIQISAVALVMALALGTLIASVRVAPVRILAIIGSTYVEFFRNIPLLVQIFFFYFGLPSIGIKLPGYWAAVLGLSLYTAAFVAEAIRSGILSVPRGQLEAAQASGLSYAGAMRLIVLPQAIRASIPPLGNQTINLIKNSSLAGTVAVEEILHTADTLGSRTFAYTEAFAIAAVMYLILTLPSAYAINMLERRAEIPGR